MRTDQQFLGDILQAIASIRKFLASKTVRDLHADQILQGAVLYQITIIGEASNRLTRGLCSRHPEVPWHGVRNRVVHEYFALDADLLWKTIDTELDPLERQIHAILNQEFPRSAP